MDYIMDNILEKVNKELKEENVKLKENINVIISYLEETMILEDNIYFKKYQADKKLYDENQKIIKNYTTKIKKFKN